MAGPRPITPNIPDLENAEVWGTEERKVEYPRFGERGHRFAEVSGFAFAAIAAFGKARSGG